MSWAGDGGKAGVVARATLLHEDVAFGNYADQLALCAANGRTEMPLSTRILATSRRSASESTVTTSRVMIS